MRSPARRRNRLAPAVLALALALPAGLRAQSAPAPSADSTAARVDRVFARWSSTGSPGCAVAAEQGGRPVLSRAYGMADLEHAVTITPETVFEAGSVSKQFTAAAVLLLAQEGRLSLDDPARKHVPELPDYGTPVTLRQMMNHTAGLRDWGTVVAAAGWPRGSRVHTHAHVLDVVSRQRSLNYEPGAEFLYSNTGYNLLAVVVERVSGMPFAEFTRQRIFVPLGMTRTQWRDDYTRVVKDRAVGYRAAPESGFRSDMPFENVHGNGGLLTTVGDLLRWNQNFTHGRVGGRALVDEMQRQARLTGGRQIEYAAGLYVTDHLGVPEISHGGATAGYRAYLARYPRNGLSVALLCNLGSINPGDLAHRTAELFLPARGEPAAPPLRSAPTAAQLARLAGQYRSRRDGEPMRLVVADGKLRIAGGRELTALSPTLFRVGQGQARIAVDAAGAGARPGLRVLEPDGDTVAFEPVADAAPTAAELAAYAGEYNSGEAEVTYVVSVKGGKLTLRRRPDVDLTLTPVYADAFAADNGWLVRFQRDASGRVTGLSMGLGRVRDLRLTREPR